jgi:drug/metabolite transporter (DMT)-like permease
MLLLAAVIWGSGNVAQKLVLEEVAPFAALMCRGVLGLVTISPWLRVRIDRAVSSRA